MTRLLVLGGGRHQVPLIRRAEERGIAVVQVDFLESAPGREFASFCEVADATDPVAALEIARRYEVDGVTTTGTDIPILAMTAVAEALGLPCYLTSRAAELATNKQAMYEALSSVGVPMADRLVTGPDEEPVPSRLPVVVKPVDSQGQRGVSAVRTEAELPIAVTEARAASRSGTILIEDFLEGPEFTANVWMHAGEVGLLMVNDRITYNPRPYLGIAFQHRYPSRAAENYLDEIREIAGHTATAYGIETGPVYIQMLRTSRGPFVVEAAARIGGGHESRLILHLSGWNSDDALIDIALGISPRPPAHFPANRDVLVNFVLGRGGVVDRCVPMADAEGIIEAGWYVEPGSSLQDVTNSLGRVGYFLAEGSSADDLMETAEKYYSDLELTSTSGTNLVQIPDPTDLNAP